MSSTIVQNPFLPTSIPTCRLWLDGADPAGTGVAPANGSTLSTWVDKSGLGNNATSAGSAVTYSSAGLYFGGTSYYSVPGIAGTLVNTPFVIFIVETLGATGTRLYFGDDNVNNGGAFGYSLHTGYRESNNQTFAMYGSDLEDTTVSGLGNTRIWALYLPAASNRNTRRNGTVDATFSNFNRLLAFTAPVIGRCFGGSTGYLGTISEIIIYNTDIGLGAIQQVEGYLAWKWGLQVNLPPTHPYKNSPAVFVTQSNILANLSITNQVNNAVFLPTTIPGCQLWLDAADRATQVLSGANITQWNDKSGRNNNFTTTSGTITVGADGIYPNVVIFPNSMTYMTSASSVTFTTSSSVFIVAKITNVVGGAAAQMLFTGININGGDYSIRYNSSGLFGGGTSTTDIGTSSTYFTTGNPGVTGSLATYQSYHIVDTVFSAGGTSQFTLSSSFSGNRYWFGTVGEVLVYTSAITSAQRQQLEGYLAWKWRLQANLPSNHPYKNTSAVFVTQPSILANLGANPYNNMIIYKYFNPRTISGLQFWIDGADRTSITFASANRMNGWNDKSGNGYNLSQSTTAYQPIYFSNYVNLGTASNYYMNIPQAAINNASSWSLFFVINPINSTNWILAKQFDGVNSGTLSMTYNGYRSSGTTNVLYFKAQNELTLFTGPAPLTTNSVQLITMRYDGTNMQYYLNGNLGSTTPGAFGLANLTVATNFTLGAWIVAGSFENPGTTNYNLGELQFFNNALSTSQRQQMEGYLAWKWGLQASLPSSQPFKNFPPSP